MLVSFFVFKRKTAYDMRISDWSSDVGSSDLESDGMPEEVEEEIARVKAVLEAAGATRMSVSRDEDERLRFWSGRKAAFPAMGRISTDYYCMDGTSSEESLLGTACVSTCQSRCTLYHTKKISTNTTKLA